MTDDQRRSRAKRDVQTGYQVASQSKPDTKYFVDALSGKCECPAGRRGQHCMHQQLVMEATQVAQPGERQRDDARPEKLTKLGYLFGEVTSAMQKEIRRGDVEAAVYWATLMFQVAPQYTWKRVMVTASEDIGLAAPEVVAQVNAMAAGWQFGKAGSWHMSQHQLTQAVVMLCRAPKSTEIEDLQSWTMEQIKAGVKREMPEYAVDMHTAKGKAAGKGNPEWYRDRATVCGMPVNEYTKRLIGMHPEWSTKELDDVMQEP